MLAQVSEENVEIVRRGYEAYLRGDLDVIQGDMDPDVVVYRSWFAFTRLPSGPGEGRRSRPISGSSTRCATRGSPGWTCSSTRRMRSQPQE